MTFNFSTASKNKLSTRFLFQSDHCMLGAKVVVRASTIVLYSAISSHQRVQTPFEVLGVCEYVQGGPEWRTHCQTAYILTTTPPIPTIPGTSHLFG